MMKTKKSVLIVAALLLAAVFTLGGCSAAIVFTDDYVMSEEQTPQPLLYEKDGSVMMAYGASTASIGTTDELYNFGALNAAFTKDNSSLFYIKYGEQKTSGTLTKLKADLSGAPAQIAEGVCAAQVSGDGKAVLYITGITDFTGDLYLKNDDAAPQLIANNVLPVYYGFSPKGGAIYYIVLEGSDTLALYVKKGGDAPALVTKHNETPYIQYGVCLDFISVFAADEEGRLLYSINGDDEYYGELYLYSNGVSEKIAKQGIAAKTFGNLGELLYMEADNDSDYFSLWYKNEGADAVKIADNAYAIFSNEDFYYGMSDINGSENDRRFIISESAGDNYGSETLYEQELGSEKQVIGKTDDYMSPILSPAKNCIVYGRDSKTYITRKTSGGWIESELKDAQNISYSSMFDASGKYFYYINSGPDYYAGTLCRYSVTDGSVDELGENIYTVSLQGSAVYAVSDNGDAYRADGAELKKIGQNVSYIVQASGGVFLESYSNTAYDENSEQYVFDIRFVADGEQSAQTICIGATELYAYSINYFPTIEKDPYRALEVLIGSAYYYQAQLSGEEYEEQPPLELQEAIDLSESFSQMPENDDYTGDMLAMLSEGFKNYQLWQNEAPGDKKELYRLTALLKLGDVIDDYEMDEEGDA